MEDYRVRRSLGEHVLRCSVLIAALFIMSLGIALSTKADLGVSPISCTPYVLSLALPLSMGTITILMHLSCAKIERRLREIGGKWRELPDEKSAYKFALSPEEEAELVSRLDY